MCGTGNAMSLFFRQILGPLILCWAHDYLLLGAQLAPREKRLVYVPGLIVYLKCLLAGNGLSNMTETMTACCC